MSFSMRDFLMKGFKNAIGKQAPYQIIQNAAGWLDKGVLTLSDLEEIQNALTESGATETDVLNVSGM